MARFDSVEFDRKRLRNISYKFLCNNFHKFSTANKIKIAIEALKIYDKSENTQMSQVSQIILVRNDGQQDVLEAKDGKELLSLTRPAHIKTLGDVIAPKTDSQASDAPEASPSQPEANNAEEQPIQETSDALEQPKDETDGSSAPPLPRPISIQRA